MLDLSDFLFGCLDLANLLEGYSSHVSCVVLSDVLNDLLGSGLFKVSAINSTITLELREQVLLLAELTDLDVCLGIVVEEEILILSVCLNPAAQGGILHELIVSLGAEVL